MKKLCHTAQNNELNRTKLIGIKQILQGAINFFAFYKPITARKTMAEAETKISSKSTKTEDSLFTTLSSGVKSCTNRIKTKQNSSPRRGLLCAVHILQNSILPPPSIYSSVFSFCFSN